ncbi:hypothetical protein GCM10025785_14350 [Corynebacterium canis]
MEATRPADSWGSEAAAPSQTCTPASRACCTNLASSSMRGIADPICPNIVSGHGAVTDPPNPWSLRPREA